MHDWQSVLQHVELLRHHWVQVSSAVNRSQHVTETNHTNNAGTTSFSPDLLQSVGPQLDCAVWLLTT
jgi:hypothetical protein